jgi:hypothetical protein
MKVELAAYDPSWLGAFGAEVTRIEEALGGPGLEMVEWAIVGALILGGMATVILQVGAQVNLKLAQVFVEMVSG